MRMRGETVGTFVDAVYAIAVTILALEIPGTLSDASFGVRKFAAVLLEYGVAFVLLFAFWLQHRRVNALVDEIGRVGLWTNAVILLLVCLIPRATTLVFEYGGDVTLSALRATVFEGAGWTNAEIVDVFYVVVVIAVDFGILLLLRINRREGDGEEIRALHRSKNVTSFLLVFVVGTSFLLPVENRYFLLVIPVVLFFENELVRMFERIRRRT